MKNSASIIWLDGKLCAVTENDLEKITPGVLKADGVFETMRSRDGHIPFLKDHMKRFFRGVRFYRLKALLNERQFKKHCNVLTKINNLKETRVRLMAWRDRSLHTAIVCQNFASLSASKFQKGLKAKTVLIKTSWPNPKNLKTLNYHPFRQAFLKAAKSGFDEAILLNKKKILVEGTRSNLFFIKNGILFTPALSTGCLAGITRQAVLNAAHHNKVRVKKTKPTLKDLWSAEEAFLTNATSGIMPLISVDHKRIKKGTVGPLTRQFMATYRRKSR